MPPRLAALALLVCAACGGSSATAPEPQGGPSEWDKRLSAEAEDKGREQPVHDINGRFTAKVRATGSPSMSRSEGFTEVYWPIGATAKVECLVFDARKEAADLVRRFEQILLKGARVEHREVTAGQLASRPFIGLRSEYLGAAEARGLLKLMALHTGEGTVLCAHDEPGYDATFRGVVEDFMRSLTFVKSSESAYRYRDVFEVRVRDAAIGFVESWIGALAKGNERFIQSTSLLVVSGGNIDAHDLIRIETSDAKGALLAGTYASFSNGELQSSLELKPDAKGYRIGGKKKGQDVDDVIAMKPMMGELGMNRAVATHLKKSPERTTANVFSTSNYQGVVASITTAKSVATGTALVRIELDASVLEGPADGVGRFERATISSASGKMELKRIVALDP